MIVGRTVQSLVSFQVTEDIRPATLGQTIICKKGIEESFAVIRPRTLRSYCCEFAGKQDVPIECLRFAVGGKEADLESEVRASLQVVVLNAQIVTSVLSGNLLKDALFTIQTSGCFSDIVLEIGSDIELPAHRFILATRSPLLKQLLEGQKETRLPQRQTLTISPSFGSSELFVKLINWIYTAEVYLTDDYLESIDLALLAHKYGLEDLKARCEDHLLAISDEHNLLGMLVAAYRSQTVFSSDFLEMTIHCFVESFDRVSLLFENVEERLCEQKGLVTRILSFVNSRKNKFKRVSFLSRESSIHLE